MVESREADKWVDSNEDAASVGLRAGEPGGRRGEGGEGMSR